MKKLNKYIILFLSLLSLLYKIPNKEYDYVNKQEKRILYIPNTSIYEPLMQAKDNTYYLNHDAKGNKNKLGAIFLDYRTQLQDRVILIYGHNSKTYQVPFKELENYYEEEYANTHTIIRIIENDITYQYKLFSVFVSYEDFFYMKLPKTEEERKNYITKLQNSSWYSFSQTEKEKDKIIIIQTCSFHPKFKKYKNKYLLLAAYFEQILP